MKLLTIIIPTYNMEKYLRKCLDSLMISNENMKYLEVLVINDGSTDSSSSIAHEYETMYPDTFRVIDKENGNYGSCINRGLQEATGKYVKVLDADDYFNRKIFECYMDFLKDIDADLVISDYCVVDTNGKITRFFSFPLPEERLFTLNTLPEKTIIQLWHHGVCYRTQMLRDMNYVQAEGIPYTDDEWIFKPMCRVKKIRYFKYNLYFYLRGRGGQTFDPEILKRDFSKRVVVGKSLITFYQVISDSCPEDTKWYLKLKLKSRIVPIYGYYFDNSGVMDISQLIEFDRFIMSSTPEIIKITNSITNKIGMHYVSSWREANYSTNILALQLSRLKNRILSLFK